MEITSILSELQANWNQLQLLTQRRRENLNQAYTLNKFRSELHELDIWMNDAIKRMNESEAPTTISEAEALLELHQERKAEIDGRQETFKALREYGQKLITLEGVRENLNQLDELQKELNNAWDIQKLKLKQAHQLQLFREQV